jgi:hypothetical protein
MNADGVTKDDVKLPEDDLGKQIQTDFDGGKDLLVTIVAAMGEEQVNLRSSLYVLYRICLPTPLLRPSP